jgi:glycerol-3-phosphate dehydrogenase (NAD(P)+)
VRRAEADAGGLSGWRPGADLHGSLSRNRTVGIELGKGRELPEILAGTCMARLRRGSEHGGGAGTGGAVWGGDADHGADGRDPAPGKSPKEAIRELMARPGRDE